MGGQTNRRKASQEDGQARFSFDNEQGAQDSGGAKEQGAEARMRSESAPAETATTLPADTGPRYLVIDCETTGLPKDWKAHWRDVAQWPRVVQVAWALFSDNGEPLERVVRIVRPEGFTIPAEAAAIHGISTERAMEEGIALGEMLAQLRSAAERSTALVAHNASYDGPVIAAEYCRVAQEPPFDPATMICTKEDGTWVARIPNRFNSGYKWPSLAELHRCLFGKDFEGAHDALVDVDACARCFFRMKENQQIRRLGTGRRSWP